MSHQPEPLHDLHAERGASPTAEAAHTTVESSRRQFKRVTVQVAVQVFIARTPRDIGEPFDATVIDIGRGGLCLRSRKPLLAGTAVFVRLPVAAGRWKLLFGEVCHATYADAAMYHMGVRFTPIPIEREYQNWIEELTRTYGGGDF